MSYRSSRPAQSPPVTHARHTLQVSLLLDKQVSKLCNQQVEGKLAGAISYQVLVIRPGNSIGPGLELYPA